MISTLLFSEKAVSQAAELVGKFPDPFKEDDMANRVRKNKITFYVDDDKLEAIKLKMNKIRVGNLSLYQKICSVSINIYD